VWWVKRAGLALCLGALLLVAAALPARADSTDPAAEALLAKALAAIDIESSSSPAFRLHARLQLYNGENEHEEGQLLRIWTPEGLWHYEVMLPGYQSLAVSNGKQVWTASNFPYIPFPIFQIGEATSLPRLLRSAHDLELGEPREMPGSGEKCVRGIGRLKGSRPVEFCVNSFSGDLDRVIVGRWNVTYEYSEYAAFGAKRYPRLLRVVRSDGSPLAEIRIDQMVPEERVDLRAFLPVKGAKQWPERGSCGGVKPAQLIKMIKPQYPRVAARVGVTGLVRIYAEIGVDGIPRGLWPLNATSPILMRAAGRAVKQWRYSPEVCKRNGEPLPLISDITVVFTSP
jgi:hypothetical protein